MRIFAVSLAGLLTMSAAGAAFAGGPAHEGPHGPKNAEKVEVCHKGKTISVGAKAAAKHLANHSGDTAGACQP